FRGSDVSPAGWNTHQTTIKGKTYTTIDDSDITTMLNAEIGAGRLPAPDGNRLYVVYTAPNTVVTNPYAPTTDRHIANSAQCAFTGYHDLAHLPGFNTPAYAYAVIVDPTGYQGYKPLGAPDGLTTLQSDTVVTSHEVAEAITDPDPSLRCRDSNKPTDSK